MLGLTRGHSFGQGVGAEESRDRLFLLPHFPLPPSVAAGCADSCPEGDGAALVCFGLLLSAPAASVPHGVTDTQAELRGIPVLHKPCPHPWLLRRSDSTLTVLVFLCFFCHWL